MSAWFGVWWEAPHGFQMAAFSLCLPTAFLSAGHPRDSGVFINFLQGHPVPSDKSHPWDLVSRYHSHGDLALQHNLRGRDTVESIPYGD